MNLMYKSNNSFGYLEQKFEVFTTFVRVFNGIYSIKLKFISFVKIKEDFVFDLINVNVR